MAIRNQPVSLISIAWTYTVGLRKNRPQAMYEGHDLWLNALKQRSEN